ncbi:MAG TPA: transcriptional regulator [Prosthecochloris aestuarii]|uniref:Transcriptional regulator n=1 Tax=Prosthecochloris aestuarii TaxID=1102 RepID=A0A831WVD3_PROAE|nr:transcriptional regulator [Prosthecochloris aestuarii]
MNRCRVSHLPVRENRQWDVPHPACGYTTVFRGIGDNIVYAGVNPHRENVTLDYMDVEMFFRVIDETGMSGKPLYTIIDMQKVTCITYRYKKDFVNAAYNWGPEFKHVILFNVGPEIQTVAETFAAITPGYAPLSIAGTYEDAIRKIMALEATGAAGDEQMIEHADTKDRSFLFRKEFLAALARMSWLNLFDHHVCMPDPDEPCYSYMKSLEQLQNDLVSQRSGQRHTLEKLRREYAWKVEERELLIKAQADLNNRLEQQLKEETCRLRARAASMDMELTRISTAVVEKSARLNDICRRLSRLDLPGHLKKTMTGPCSQMISDYGSDNKPHSGIEHADPAFLSLLHRRHPELNQRELRICLLIRNNHNTRDIAASIGITPRGVESIRYRQHKKLGVEKHCTIKQYLIDMRG